MPKERLNDKKTQLALAIAQRKPVSTWARQNEVPRSTAYWWASDPAVRRAAESFRRRALDQAIDPLTWRRVPATDQTTKLARGAGSESIELSTLLSILSRQKGR